MISYNPFRYYKFMSIMNAVYSRFFTGVPLLCYVLQEFGDGDTALVMQLLVKGKIVFEVWSKFSGGFPVYHLNQFLWINYASASIS